MTSISKKIVYYFISFVFIILVLYLLSYCVGNEVIFPTPFNIFNALGELIISSKTYMVLGYTLLRLIICILISFLIGTILAVIASKFEGFKLFIKPIITILRSVPLAAIIVIIMIILGFSRSPYVICMLMLIPLIYEAMLNGILNIDKDLLEVWQLESNFNDRVLFKIIFPLAKPFIKTSYIQSVGLGIKVLIMAEYICGTQNSIGRELTTSANYLEYDKVFAWTIIAIILVIVIENIPHLINFIISKLHKNK